MVLKILAITGICLGCASTVLAEARLIAQDLPGLHQKDGKGDYDATYAKAGLKLEVLPIARAFKEFDACADCCLTPANKDADFYDYNKSDFIESKPLDIAKVFIFSAPGKLAETDLKALKGKRVGGRIGIVYGKSVEKAIPDIQRIPELTQNIKKLETGRLDFIVEFCPNHDLI